MIGAFSNILAAAAVAADPGDIAAGSDPAISATMPWAGWILWLPAIACALCGVCAAMRVRNKLPGVICVGFLGGSFLITLALYFRYESAVTIHLFDWFNIAWGGGESGGSFVGNFALYVDKLTLLWMLFVTGLGTLIALYATEYMEHDVGQGGYARFFAGVSIFLFAMGSLVMGDNLLMLYLGWEGVGFASYWLIGYYYTRPSAVAAAKKAFIMNRIGDLGLALGIYLIYHYFGTLQYDELFAMIEAQFGSGHEAAEAASEVQSGGWMLKVVPFLLMLGAFGKSAQLPLYVWLPDAMEGPTPVSALIHAATMVTAGVYLLCRMFPVMELNAAALPTVAWIGGATALLSATIGMAQYDIKRIMAYSTVSQLGYMFVGIGVFTTFGAGFHVFTHAFFKAVLFLTCGAIMHGFAGQLDLRKLSGLRRMDGWRITSYTMLIGCLCLAGIPLTSGFFSKDAILAEAFVSEGPGYRVLGWLMIFTAGLTAYYTFRVWFRVCAGPVKYEMGDEHHGDDHGHAEPHAPRAAINITLLIIAVGALLAAFASGWAKGMVSDSSAAHGVPGEHGGGEAHLLLGQDPHVIMYWISGGVAIVGSLIAFWFHLANRSAADSLRDKMLSNPAMRWLPIAMENKWYVDEFYDFLIRKPLWVFSFICYGFDRFIIDLVCVDGIARIPRLLGRAFQPLQNGVLQSYAVSMAGGIGLVAILVLYMPELINWLNSIMGGQG